MLWEKYPIYLDHLTLQEAYQTIGGDPPSKIPFLVWLFENPKSLFSLPGKIDLYRHDCLHLLLRQGFSSAGEAYVLGFTMGNDPKTHRGHIFLFKLIARFFYPSPYRFSALDLLQFERGIQHGQRAPVKGLNQRTFQPWQPLSLRQLRHNLGLSSS